MSVCARLAGSSSHQWGWLRRELAAIDADSRARAEADSSAVRSEFNTARAKFDPNLDIQLIDSASLPEHLRELVEKRPSAEGLWNNGSIYLLEDRISPGRVRKVLLHEVVAHEGLRRVFGKDYDSFLRQIVNQYADPISSLAVRRHIDITTPDGQLKAADEFLAELAESRLAPDSRASASAAAQNPRAPQGAAPRAEAPLSGPGRAQPPTPRSGSTAAPGGSALSSGNAATLAEPNGQHLRGGSAADTFERPTDATLPQSGPVRFADDPAYEAKAAAIAKILYRYTGTSYLVEPEEAASILAKGGWRLDPVNDEELLRYSAAIAVKMKRERALKARHERERNAISNADEWTKLLMEKYGENFKINPGPKYDGSLATVTYTAQSFKDLESDEIITEITVSKLKKVNGIWKIYEEVDKKK